MAIDRWSSDSSASKVDVKTATIAVADSVDSLGARPLDLATALVVTGLVL